MEKSVLSGATYRPEIDGLRAIAVVSVIVYHLKLQVGESTFLPGGFFGVDLFFVLSGFLIARLIMVEIETTGRLDLGAFYWRRMRRIVPAFLLVALVSLPAAWLILLPSELERFAQSILAGLLFVANIFWFVEQGDYGAQSALLQPFLHMWSLAIEEQFYLVFPLAFLFVARRWAVGPVLLAVLVLSFAVAYATTEWRATLSFFSPTSRAWELLAGVGIAWASLRYPELLRAWPGGRLMPALGLVLIVWPILTTDLSETAHPGVATLPVVVGTCLILWFARPDEPVTRLLSSHPFTSVGLLSYSLYLWHYPVFAFGRHVSYSAPGPLDMAVWIGLTVILSYAGYRLVERPFRHGFSTHVFAASVTIAVATLAVFSTLTLRNDGYAARLGALADVYAENEFDNAVLRDQSWSLLDDLAGSERIAAWNAQAPSKNEIEALWYSDELKQNVLVVGNSHSKDVFNALHLNRHRFPDMEFARFTVGTAVPEDQLDLLVQSPNYLAADVVLLTSRYHDMPMERLPEFVARLRGSGKTVVVVGNTPEFEDVGALPLFDWYIRANGAEADLDEVNRMAFASKTGDGVTMNARVKEIARTEGAAYLAREPLVCDEGGRTCTLVTPDRRKALYDSAHWTLDGARYFGLRIAETGWLDDVMPTPDVPVRLVRWAPN